MCKILILLMLWVTHEILGAKNSEASPEELKMIRNLHDSCVEQTGVSESAIAEVNKRNYDYIDTDHKLKTPSCSREFYIASQCESRIFITKLFPLYYIFKGCYMTCMLTTIGVLDDNGVFDHDAFIDIVIDPMKDMANKMKAHCKDKIKNVHTGDICETGFKIHTCIREANPETYKLF